MGLPEMIVIKPRRYSCVPLQERSTPSSSPETEQRTFKLKRVRCPVQPVLHSILRNFSPPNTCPVRSRRTFAGNDNMGSVYFRFKLHPQTQVPAYYALILRSLTVLEGLPLYADPNFKVLVGSYPYFSKRLLTYPNPYLRDPLIELLFKDGRFRWNRLENLLQQGQKVRDFSAKDALQPILKLLLGPDGEALRVLVVKEAVRVTEAIILGTLLESYNSVPAFMRTLISSGNASSPFTMSVAEQESMMELRAQVFWIWELPRSSQNFDPALLQPIIQVLQEPDGRSLGGCVFGGITQRLAACLLHQVLRAPSTLPTATCDYSFTLFQCRYI